MTFFDVRRLGAGRLSPASIGLVLFGGLRPPPFGLLKLKMEDPKSEARNQKSDPSSLRFDATRGNPKLEMGSPWSKESAADRGRRRGRRRGRFGLAEVERMSGSCSRISRGSRLMRCSFVSSLQASGIIFVVRFLGLRFAPTQAIISRAYSTFEFGLREKFFVGFVAFCE